MLGWLRSLFRRDAAETAALNEPVTESVPTYEKSSALRTRVKYPDYIIFDCETTGLHATDRIVSLGAVRLGADLSLKRTLHLVFNPGRKSHWAAERVHGLSAHYLAYQPAFRDHLDEVQEFFAGAILVAHNLEFDTRMLNQEFALCGVAPLSQVHGARCTMLEWRERSDSGRGSLDDALNQIGLNRAGQVHGALEDAILAARVLRWLDGLPHEFPASMHAPSNERTAPAQEGRPRGRPKKDPGGAKPLSTSSHALSGLRVVLTGNLDSLSREEAEARLVMSGALRQTNVNRLTDYLVTGAMPGPAKMRVAKELQASDGKIKIIQEAEFLALLG
jgi:DNA polymerase-3 subunit epsilon